MTDDKEMAFARYRELGDELGRADGHDRDVVLSRMRKLEEGYGFAKGGPVAPLKNGEGTGYITVSP